MVHDMPLLMRFLAKLMLDILPAVLASVIGGFLFTQYQWGHAAAPAPASEQRAMASAEVMKLVRDEHALIDNFLNAQMAVEKARLAAEEKADARAAADGRRPAAAAPRRFAVATLAAKPLTPRLHTPMLHAPIVIAQAQPAESAAPAAPADPSADSLLLKTVRLKDHIVNATQHVVAAIGGIPSWIAAVGDRIGGQSMNPPPASRLVSATW